MTIWFKGVVTIGYGAGGGGSKSDLKMVTWFMDGLYLASGRRLPVRGRNAGFWGISRNFLSSTENFSRTCCNLPLFLYGTGEEDQDLRRSFRSQGDVGVRPG